MTRWQRDKVIRASLGWSLVVGRWSVVGRRLSVVGRRLGDKQIVAPAAAKRGPHQRLGRLERQPTVGRQDDPRDERGIVRSQKQRAAGDLLGAAVAPKRVAVARELIF